LVSSVALGAQARAEAAGFELAEGPYRIDPRTALVRFELPATMHTVRGESTEVSGTVVVRRAETGYDLEGHVRIAAGSLGTGNRRRDRKMREESLLASVHPDIVFEPRHLAAVREPPPGGSGRFLLEGDLTVRGVKRPIELSVEVVRSGERLVVDGSTTLAWADFGVPDPSFFLVRIGKRLTVSVHVELVR
jgi:polyisoprenoid-binding protein YceI